VSPATARHVSSGIKCLPTILPSAPAWILRESRSSSVSFGDGRRKRGCDSEYMLLPAD
jgi:hypothetical protein